MTRTPTPAIAVGEAVPPSRAPDDGYRVRPLPTTEPDTGDRPHTVAAPGAPSPEPAAPEREVPVRARRAAHALVTMALEVVDRRRPPQQTRGAFPPHLVEMLRSLARAGVPGKDLGPARIHRLHVNAAGPAFEHTDEITDTDYEICATYARGPRLFAVAARIRVTHTGAVCTALRLV